MSTAKKQTAKFSKRTFCCIKFLTLKVWHGFFFPLTTLFHLNKTPSARIIAKRNNMLQARYEKSLKMLQSWKWWPTKIFSFLIDIFLRKNFFFIVFRSRAFSLFAIQKSRAFPGFWKLWNTRRQEKKTSWIFHQSLFFCVADEDDGMQMKLLILWKNTE